MKKLFSILLASILVLGPLAAVMPIDSAYAGHVTTARTLGNAVTGITITDAGVISDIDGTLALLSNTGGITITSTDGLIRITSDIAGDTGEILIDTDSGGIAISAGADAIDPGADDVSINAEGEFDMTTVTGGITLISTEGPILISSDAVAGTDASIIIDTTSGGISISAGASPGTPGKDDVSIDAAKVITVTSVTGGLSVISTEGTLTISSDAVGGTDAPIIIDTTSGGISISAGASPGSPGLDDVAIDAAKVITITSVTGAVGLIATEGTITISSDAVGGTDAPIIIDTTSGGISISAGASAGSDGKDTVAIDAAKVITVTSVTGGVTIISTDGPLLISSDLANDDEGTIIIDTTSGGIAIGAGVSPGVDGRDTLALDAAKAITITSVTGAVGLIATEGTITISSDAVGGTDAPIIIDTTSGGISISAGASPGTPGKDDVAIDAAKVITITSVTGGITITSTDGPISIKSDLAGDTEGTIALETATGGISISAGTGAALTNDELLLVGKTSIQLGEDGTNFLSFRTLTTGAGAGSNQVVFGVVDNGSKACTNIEDNTVIVGLSEGADLVFATPTTILGADEILVISESFVDSATAITICILNVSGADSANPAEIAWSILIIDVA